MPSFNIVKEVKPENTFRTANIVSNFDLDVDHIREHFTGNIDIESCEWNVGLIVEDVKGYRDPASAAYAKYIIKRKLLLERYGIRIKEL